MQQQNKQNTQAKKLLNSGRSMHFFQNTFYQGDHSPRKMNAKKEMIFNQSPTQHQLSTSLSVTKSAVHISQAYPSAQSNQEVSVVQTLIKQIRELESTVEKLKEENQKLKEKYLPNFQDVQIRHIQLHKLHNFLKEIQELKVENTKLKLQFDQLNLIMKIHLQPINEVMSKYLNGSLAEMSSITVLNSQNDSTHIEHNQYTQIKIHANINRYQKCKTGI